MIVLGVDPGPTQCGVVVLEDADMLSHAIVPVPRLLETLYRYRGEEATPVDLFAMERVAAYGMASQALTETAEVFGALRHEWTRLSDIPFLGIYRAQIKKRLLGTTVGNDAQVRAALLQRFGGAAAAAKAPKCGACKGKGTVRSSAARGAASVLCPACAGAKTSASAGPLCGVASHEWAALAVAVVGRELLCETRGLPRTGEAGA